jgi:hypothetical protein
MADLVDGPGGLEPRVAVLEEIARATRETLADIRSELRCIRGELVSIRTDVADLRTEVRVGLADLRTELKADMAGLRTEMRAEMAGLRTEVAYLKGRIEQLPSTWQMITGIIAGQVALGALFVAAFRFAGKG